MAVKSVLGLERAIKGERIERVHAKGPFTEQTPASPVRECEAPAVDGRGAEGCRRSGRQQEKAVRLGLPARVAGAASERNCRVGREARGLVGSHEF